MEKNQGVKNTKRFVSAVLTIVAAANLFYATNTKAIADTKKGNKTKVEETVTITGFEQYTVKEGDNASRISEKICNRLHIEQTTKYWPVIAFLNDYPRIIHPGDIIIYPKDAVEMENLYQNLRKTGWLARYIQKQDIYGTKKKAARTTLGQLLSEIYGPGVCIDPDFVALYLKAQGLEGRFDIDSIVNGDNDTLFLVTEWIPTLDELQEYTHNHGM